MTPDSKGESGRRNGRIAIVAGTAGVTPAFAAKQVSARTAWRSCSSPQAGPAAGDLLAAQGRSFLDHDYIRGIARRKSCGQTTRGARQWMREPSRMAVLTLRGLRWETRLRRLGRRSSSHAEGITDELQRRSGTP